MKKAEKAVGKTGFGWKTVFLMGTILWAQAAFPSVSRAQENDPGLIRALGTDSASVENTCYLLAAFNNDTSPYHGIYLYGEALVKLQKDFGLEIDFPNLMTREPLGNVPLVVGPIGLYVRYEAFHFGGWNSETAGSFSIEGGGAYGISNDIFPHVGSSWTLEALGGVRLGKVFIQGNYGFMGGIDAQVQSQWQANTALGWDLGSNWYVQGEIDFTAKAGPPAGASLSFIPQIAFQPGDWLFEFGESFDASPAGTTELLAARTF